MINFPLSVFNRKARSAYCATWGFPSSPCRFAVLECLRTTCSGALVTDTSACVSGYAFRVGFAIKRFARRTLHVRGMREEGGRRETHEYWSKVSSTSEPVSSPLPIWESSAAAFSARFSALMLFLLPGLYQHSPACFFPQCSHGSTTAASFFACTDARFAPAPCPLRGRRVFPGVLFCRSVSFTMRST